MHCVFTDRSVNGQLFCVNLIWLVPPLGGFSRIKNCISAYQIITQLRLVYLLVRLYGVSWCERPQIKHALGILDIVSV